MLIIFDVHEPKCSIQEYGKFMYIDGDMTPRPNVTSKSYLKNDPTKLRHKFLLQIRDHKSWLKNVTQNIQLYEKVGSQVKFVMGHIRRVEGGDKKISGL